MAKTGWYLRRNGGSEIGPVSTEKIRAGLAGGKLTDKTRTRREGGQSWRLIAQRPEFTSEEKEEQASEAGWFLKIGSKKAGPLSSERIRSLMDAGRIPEKARLRREGTDEWLAPSEVSFTSEEEDHEGPASDVSQETEAVEASSSDLFSFEQPYRIERSDIRRGIRLGLHPERVKTSLAMMGTIVGLAGLSAAGYAIHAILGLIIGILAAPVAVFVGLLGQGALSHQFREWIETDRIGGFRDSLSYARENFSSITVSPLLVSLAAGGATAALFLLGAITMIPYAGPIVTGLVFGAHILVAGATVFLLGTAGLSWIFGPTIVAFESSGIKSTFRLLCETVKGAPTRLGWWGLVAGFYQFVATLCVLLAGAVLLGIPVALNFFMGGLNLFTGPGQAGIVLAGIWAGALVAILLGGLVSVSNALMSFVYLGARPGNDDLPTRATVVQQRRNTSQS